MVQLGPETMSAISTVPQIAGQSSVVNTARFRSRMTDPTTQVMEENLEGCGAVVVEMRDLDGSCCVHLGRRFLRDFECLDLLVGVHCTNGIKSRMSGPY